MPKLIVKPDSSKSGKFIEKATVKKTSKAINTDWLASNVSPTNAPALHRLYIRVATGTVVKLEIDDGTNSNEEFDLNEGNALTAGSLYNFDIMIPDGYSYNVQHETGTQNVDLWIIEGGQT